MSTRSTAILGCGDKWSVETKKVPCPVLIVTGDCDFYVNIDRVYQAAKELPEGSQLLHLHGAGHCMYLEKDYYKKTRETILDFLNK